jgi:hypothetical protein
MNSMTVALIAFGCIGGGSLLGSFLRTVLPEHHLRDDSKDALKMGIGIIATLAALVLGLLIGSAKSSFDAMNQGMAELGAKIILLDRVLAHYGPETKEARQLVQSSVVSVIEQIWPESKTAKTGLGAVEAGTGMEAIQDKLRQLAPSNDAQRLLQSQAVQLSSEIAQARWLLIERAHNALPTALLVVMVFWFTVLFGSIGLFAPPNATVLVVMLVCTLSVAGAIFLLLEMNHPLDGMIQVSSAPLQKALEHLGR